MHRAASGRASALRGGAEVLGEGVSLCGGRRRRCSGRACRCAGRAKEVGEEWVVRSAGLTHICRSGSRARIYLIYVRPVHAVKSQSWGRKAVPAFTLPPHRLRRRPRSNRHPPATVIHNGLSTEKLSTSLLAALCKTFSPSRLRTRIYNIEFALAPLWHRVPRRRAQGGGGRKAKADVPSCSADQCRLRAEQYRLRAE